MNSRRLANSLIGFDTKDTKDTKIDRFFFSSVSFVSFVLSTRWDSSKAVNL